MNDASGYARDRGFTLVELLLVLFIVALLASIVAPSVIGSMQKARESTLKEDLHVLRKALDDHYADHGKYPDELAELVEKRYVRRIPVDPITGRSDTWVLAREDSREDEGEGGGIRDIHSGAEGQARDGQYYKDL